MITSKKELFILALVIISIPITTFIISILFDDGFFHMGQDIEMTFKLKDIIIHYLLSFVIDVPFFIYYMGQIKRAFQDKKMLAHKILRQNRDLAIAYVFIIASLLFLWLHANVVSVILGAILVPLLLIFLVPFTILYLMVRYILLPSYS